MKPLLYIIIVGISVIYADSTWAQNNAIFSGGNADGFASITIGSTGSEVPLPIELLSFTAKCRNESIILKWSTASETNNDYFTLERSKDGIKWEHVGYVKGVGNSSMTTHYIFTDENSYKNLSYYRLKQTDFDGKFKYVRITDVENCLANTVHIDIYPNPSNGIFTITSNIIIKSVQISNLLGELVYQRPNLNEPDLTIDISASPKGIYLVEIADNDHVLHKQMINLW